MPLRAYVLIYNDWFRSDYLQDPIGIEFGDYNEDSTHNYDDKYVLMRRGKRFDYYTSCLPFPQAGPGVEISLGGNAPVYANDGTNVSGIPANSISNVAGAGRLLYRETDGNCLMKFILLMLKILLFMQIILLFMPI